MKKIIDEKGKLFGFINLVDLMVIATIFAVIAGVAYTLFAPAVAEVVSPNVNMTVTVRIRGASSFLVEELERNSQVGKQMVSGSSYIDSTITAMEIEPYVTQTTRSDGVIVDATDPTKKDIVFTFEAVVKEGTAVPTVGSQDVRVGRTFTVKTNDFEMNAIIESVVFE